MGPCLTTREGAQPLLRGDASTRSARIFLKKMCPAFARVIVFTYTGAGYSSGSVHGRRVFERRTDAWLLHARTGTLVATRARCKACSSPYARLHP